MTQPTFYIPHGGGPCFFMPDPTGMWKGMEAFLRGLTRELSTQPSVVLIISSHWEEDEFTLGTHPSPPLIYDYYGFPEYTYRLSYPAAGHKLLAERSASLFINSLIANRNDKNKGLDHGVFVPLLLIYPQANIPVVPLSLKRGLSPEDHLAAGRGLTQLRSENILIIASGMSYHNMRGFGPRFTAASERFDDWLNDAVCNHSGADRSALLANWEKAPEARTAHPREEHFISLLVAAGAAENEPATRVYNEKVMDVAISGFRFG